MAIIINFNEYVNLRKKKGEKTEVSSIAEGGKIIDFNKEGVCL